MSYKSRKGLHADLTTLKAKGKFPGLYLPAKHTALSNEVYGPAAMIYLQWGSYEERRAGERALARLGHKVQYTYHPGSAYSEVRVSYFKGHHWSE